MNRQTPRLPKPYQFVKSTSGRMVYEHGVGLVSGVYHLFVDPRGEVSFAIGIPDDIAKTVQGKYNFVEIPDEHGAVHHAVIEVTADEVIETATRVFRDYADVVLEKDRVEVILLSFSAVDSTHQFIGRTLPSLWPQALSEGVYLQLSVERGFNVAGNFCTVDDNGALVRRYGIRGKMIPFTEGAWNALLWLSQEIETMAKSLGGIFDMEGHQISEVLSGITPSPDGAKIRRRRKFDIEDDAVLRAALDHAKKDKVTNLDVLRVRLQIQGFTSEQAERAETLWVAEYATRGKDGEDRED